MVSASCFFLRGIPLPWLHCHGILSSPKVTLSHWVDISVSNSYNYILYIPVCGVMLCVLASLFPPLHSEKEHYLHPEALVLTPRYFACLDFGTSEETWITTSTYVWKKNKSISMQKFFLWHAVVAAYQRHCKCVVSSIIYQSILDPDLRWISLAEANVETTVHTMH